MVKPEFIDSDGSLNQPHTMVAKGDDLSSRWALMQDFANEVNSIGYEYRPFSQNSNSLAGGALQRAGFLGPGNEFPERFDRQLALDPASGETKSFYVPGFEAPLTNPINAATPMPVPLDGPAAPLAPTNGVPTPDRHGFLDNGSGSSGSAAAPVEGGESARYLGRRTFGASQGSVFDAGAPVASVASRDGIAGGSGNSPSQMPQPQKSEGALTLMDAYLQYRKQLDANPSQAAAIDADAPASTLVPSDDSNFSGGLLGRMAAVMGVDPQNADQPAPPPQDNDLRAFSRDPVQLRTLRRFR